MPTPKRRPQTNLIAQLISHPQRYNYFQAVRMIDLWLRRSAPLHGKTLDDVLRYKNSVSLAFPPSQIEALSVDRLEQLPAIDPPELRQLRHVHLTPAFMGFLGVKGVLPHDYTATIAAQIYYDHNEGGRAFFDTFSHRSMTLYYRAWAKARIEWRDGDGVGGGSLLDVQRALAGRLMRRRPTSVSTVEAVAEPSVLPDEVLARYAALLRHRPMSGDMIAGVLTEYFSLPFRFQSLVGDWMNVGPEHRSVLGHKNITLGQGAMLGVRYWRRDAIARLWVGPLARADFDRLLDMDNVGRALKAMLALFAMPNMVFEVRPMLRATDITCVKLDGRTRLGQGAFLLTTVQTVADDQARYHIAF